MKGTGYSHRGLLAEAEPDEIMPWMLLIGEIKRNPILWDSRLEDYKLSERKPILWETIARNSDTNEVSERNFVSIQ